MSFLCDQLCFGDVNELMQFLSQYDIKYMSNGRDEENLLIDCKLTQMSIAQKQMQN